MLISMTLVDTSPSAAGTFASTGFVQSSANWSGAGVFAPLDDADAIDVTIAARGATGGTLGIVLQKSPDGVVWTDMARVPDLAAAAAPVVYSFAVTHLSQPTSAAPVVVGQGLSPAIAANVVVQGGWGNRLRAVYIAGAGTTAGAPVTITVNAQRPGPVGYT